MFVHLAIVHLSLRFKGFFCVQSKQVYSGRYESVNLFYRFFLDWILLKNPFHIQKTDIILYTLNVIFFFILESSFICVTYSLIVYNHWQSLYWIQCILLTISKYVSDWSTFEHRDWCSIIIEHHVCVVKTCGFRSFCKC